MSLLDDIKTHLEDQAVVDDNAWKVFIGWAPDSQDQLIALNPTGGLPQDTHGGENVQDTFQVLVRAAQQDYAACESKWRDVFDTLHDSKALDASPYYIWQILADNTGPIVFYDEKRRPTMTLNMRVIRAKP